MKNIFYLLLFFVSLSFGQTIRYVSVSGAGTRNGTSEANAYTMSEAISNASPNTDFRVKAGNYGATNYTISTSGTLGNPIRFIGYKTTFGDITTTAGSTFEYGDTYVVSDYPTFVGVRSGNNVSGIAFTINGAYVEIHNFQIKDKISGINSYGSYNKLINVIIHDMGNYTGYSGTGVIMNGGYSELRNSYIINGVQLFTNTRGDFQIIDNSWFGCDQDRTNDYSTDYYLLFTGSGGNGADNNTISNNTVWREPGQVHQGHGLILKGDSKNNNIINNTILNSPLEFSFNEVSDNIVTGGIVQGTGTESGNVDYAFILIANGAHHNTFENMTVTGDVGVRFSDWNDGWTPSPDTDAVDAGNNNSFKNIIFKNLHKGVQFAWHWYGQGVASNNVFDSCVFYGITNELFTVERGNTGTVFRNCIIANNSATTYEGGNNSLARPANTNYPLNVSFINTTFFSNGFSTPSGTNNLTSNPLFTNAGAGDFTPQSGSPSIDAGSIATIALLDFNGLTRGSSPDRGPFEFDGGADEDAPSVLTNTVLQNTINTHRIDWTLNEPSKGRVVYDTNTGTVLADYPFLTTEEPNFLTRHIQTIGNNPSNVNAFLTSNTTYYYRIVVEDAAGNDALSSEYSFTTLSNGDIPVISLIGDSEVFLNTSETYAELGAAWSDAEDGTGSATVGGNTVNDNAVGTYIVTYNFTDSDANVALEINRTVYVSSPTTEYFTPNKMISAILGSRFFYINNVKKSF